METTGNEIVSPPHIGHRPSMVWDIRLVISHGTFRRQPELDLLYRKLERLTTTSDKMKYYSLILALGCLPYAMAGPRHARFYDSESRHW